MWKSDVADGEVKRKIGTKYCWREGLEEYQVARDPVVSSTKTQDVMDDEMMEMAYMDEGDGVVGAESPLLWRITGDELSEWISGSAGGGVVVV